MSDTYWSVDGFERVYKYAPYKPKYCAPMHDEEVRETSATGAAKGVKLAHYDRIPTWPLYLLACHYGKGNGKYPAVNGLDNWRNGYEWSKSYAALQRHINLFWSGEDIDEETGSHHLVAAMWHCATMLEWDRNEELKQKFDDRQDPRNPLEGK